MKIPDKIYLEMKRFSEQSPEAEACGLLYQDQGGEMSFKKCRNVHPEPQKYFEISCKEYLDTSHMGDIKAAFHSHPETDGPSAADERMSRKLEVPFIIYSLKKNKFYYLKCN
jgi:proteasome lid subunit RPN8/RPN11